MLILFGSRAKGTASPAGDIDIAVAGGDYDAFVAAVETEVRSLLILDCTNFSSNTLSVFAGEILHTGVLLYDRRQYVKNWTISREVSRFCGTRISAVLLQTPFTAWGFSDSFGSLSSLPGKHYSR